MLDDKANINEIEIKDIFNHPARPVIGVDVERYKALLDDPALSEAEKESFLQALWSIVVTFVDLGFGVHPLQEVCERQDERYLGELKENFDSADQMDSYDRNKKDNGPADGPEAT